MRRLSGLWRQAAASVGVLIFGLTAFGLMGSGVASAQVEPEVYIRVSNTETSDPDDLVEVRLGDDPSAPRGRLPVLFVHGHNLFSDDDNNRNYTSPTAAASDIIAAARPKNLPAPEPGINVAERRLLALMQDTSMRSALKPRREKLLLKPNDKGEFRARLSPNVPGVHTASITIEGDDARLGRFSRTATATIVVRFAPVPLKPRDLFNSECNVGGRRYVRLILSPRDAQGRSIGPGFASAISAQLSAGRTVGGTQDLGDGSYMLVLQLAPGDDPALKLEADGAALFNGRLSQLLGK